MDRSGGGTASRRALASGGAGALMAALPRRAAGTLMAALAALAARIVMVAVVGAGIGLLRQGAGSAQQNKRKGGGHKMFHGVLLLAAVRI